MPGVLLFAKMLENTFFPPNTPKNRDFRLMMNEWLQTLWIIISIPGKDMKKARSVARNSKLQIIKGVPTLTSGGKTEKFVFDLPTVYHLKVNSADAHAIVNLDSPEPQN
jgi:hypothetical protein